MEAPPAPSDNPGRAGRVLFYWIDRVVGLLLTGATGAAVRSVSPDGDAGDGTGAETFRGSKAVGDGCRRWRWKYGKEQDKNEDVF
ncbi:hypothetical protein NEUTE2DRAFT_58182 [Neurospora tetrasperma FGSC 2509]|nr:hypothetical protein NEUTE2DRAFT_58182 [Neurospora tetrasperma FGSC 2509]